MTWVVDAFALDTTGPEDGDDSGDEDAPSFRQLALPSAQLHGLWASLHYDCAIKRRLLRYADSALLFGERGVDAHLVSFGRVVLLHGPPGSGKTSLCKALAQKLAIRLGRRYASAELVEVNAHSLFSRWFSESGKLVARLFERVREKLEEPDALVFVLVDEVESLAAARQGGGGGGGEPGDALRAVNALLTQLDSLRAYPNCMILATSNITGAIDVAFLDRADIKAFLGDPNLQSRYQMLAGSLAELARVGIVAAPGEVCSFAEAKRAAAAAAAGGKLGGMGLRDEAMRRDDGGGGGGGEAAAAAAMGARLLEVAAAAEGLSGRALRKLPFLAHAAGNFSGAGCPWGAFMDAMAAAAAQERRDRAALQTA